MLFGLIVFSQLNNDFTSESHIMNDFSQLNGLNVHIFGDSLNLKVVEDTVFTKIGIFDDCLNGNIKKVFVLLFLKEREKLERFVRFFQENGLRFSHLVVW